MLRLVAFFAVAFLLAILLGHLPWIGPFFAHTGIFGVWLVALGLSFALTRWGERAVRRRRDAGELRRLLAVGTPHTRGKAGALLLAQGRVRLALPHLAAAAEGEPESDEWRFRHGLALLASGRAAEAASELETLARRSPEYAFGQAQMRLAEARTQSRDGDGALEALAVFERNHGPSPESAYRRGLALAALRRKAEARRAFDEVGGLAKQVARYQRRSAGLWNFKAFLARLR